MVGTCRARRTRRVWVPSVCMVCYPSSPRARDAHGAPLHYGYTYYARRTLAVRAHAGASALPDRSGSVDLQTGSVHRRPLWWVVEYSAATWRCADGHTPVLTLARASVRVRAPASVVKRPDVGSP